MSDDKHDDLTPQEGSTGGGSSLLDDLMKQAKLEADQEKLKLEKQLQDKQAAQRKQKEDEERRKRDELRKRLEEETQRRQDLLRKKQGGEPDSPEVVQEKVAREAAVAQVLSSKSTVTKIERKPSKVPVAAAGGVALVFAVLAALLFAQHSALPAGLAGWRFSLDNAVGTSALRARIKMAELKTNEVEGSVKTGRGTELGLRKELDELKAAVAQKDQQIATLQAQVDAIPKARPTGNGGEKKDDGDSIKIDNSIFKGGKKR